MKIDMIFIQNNQLPYIYILPTCTSVLYVWQNQKTDEQKIVNWFFLQLLQHCIINEIQKYVQQHYFP